MAAKDCIFEMAGRRASPSTTADATPNVSRKSTAVRISDLGRTEGEHYVCPAVLGAGLARGKINAWNAGILHRLEIGMLRKLGLKGQKRTVLLMDWRISPDKAGLWEVNRKSRITGSYGEESSSYALPTNQKLQDIGVGWAFPSDSQAK
jgi:hypothetical protein